MMGVRRTSVTGVASQLQQEGLITYKRGKITILSIDLVQKRSCECAKTVRDLYAEVFGASPNAGVTFPRTELPV